MDKWLSRIGVNNLNSCSVSGDKVANVKNDLTLATMAPGLLSEREKKLGIEDNQKEELKSLIQKISHDHGSDDEQFLENYINDVICTWSHNLDAALACFREISLKHKRIIVANH